MSRDREEQYEGLSRRGWGLLIGIGTWLLLFAAGRRGVSPIAGSLVQLEQQSLDLRFQLREHIAPRPVTEDIAILMVDQEAVDFMEHRSLLEEGVGEENDRPYPWYRETYGLTAQYLRAMGARAVFFDFLFTGKSVYDYDGYLDDDQNFAARCEQAGNVYQALYFEGQLDPDEGLAGEGLAGEPGDSQVAHSPHEQILSALLARTPRAALERAVVAGGPPDLPRFRQVQVPIPPLAETAAGLGAVNNNREEDGVVRRAGLLYAFEGKTYGSIPLMLARDLARAEGRPGELAWDDAAQTLLLDQTRIPLDSSGRMWINWHRIDPDYHTTYETRSFHLAALDAQSWELGQEPQLGREFFEGKIVLIGTSAAGLADLKATPISSQVPGVEILATTLDNILEREFLQRHRPGDLWQHGLTLLLFLLAGQLFVRKQSAALSSLAFLALLGATVGAATWLFVSHSLWLDLVLPGAGLVLLFAEAQTVQYFTEGRQKRQIRSVFQRYLPPTVVNEVLKVPLDQLKLGGDRRELTVSFSDIEGFTSISEALDPEQLVSMLNVYLSEMSDIVSRTGGTLDKYIGDCIMAFWGAPLPVENGAVQACRAALECNERLNGLREEFAARGLPRIYARIGINTGDMLVGNMGSNQHFSYTVMGDAVNLASRLEGANKQYGSYLMISETTRERTGAAFETRALDLLKVKGKSQPVAVYELMSAAGELTQERQALRRAYEEGLELYRARQWERAVAAFEAALAIAPEDGPSKTYKQRCEHYRASPPPEGWDGVYTMTTK